MILRGPVPVGSPLLARNWKNMLYSAVASQSGRSQISADWLNLAFNATDGPEFNSLMAVPRPGYECLESCDIRLFEALSEKVAGIVILQNDLDMGVELETARRERGDGGLSVLWLLRMVYNRIAPLGSAAGEQARNTELISKLSLDAANPMTDLDSFLVRLSKAKQICLQGSTEPAIIALVEAQLFNKLKSQLELRGVARLGGTPTLYEFGYSSWLMSSDDLTQQNYGVLYNLVARFLQFKTTVNADKSRDQDADRIGKGTRTVRGTPATGADLGGLGSTADGFTKTKKALKRERAALAASLHPGQGPTGPLPPDQLTVITQQLAALNVSLAAAKGFKGGAKEEI